VRGEKPKPKGTSGSVPRACWGIEKKIKSQDWVLMTRRTKTRVWGKNDRVKGAERKTGFIFRIFWPEALFD
jgi:hypothetical protein